MGRFDWYQYPLIALGVAATVFLGIFFYREVYPEYRVYQNDFIALEEFRSTYTGEAPSPFQEGVKQIVLEREDRGPPTIDRCTSCHVALDIPYFSPQKIAHDINGNILLTPDGRPQLIPNESYIWDKLDQAIQALTDEKINADLTSQGKGGEVQKRLKQAEAYKALKVAQVGGQTYDVTKVLMMHPLIGHETRPFEYHPIEEYGCTVCHNGNGRGLTTEKAHGPVFDGQYDIEFMGPTPTFTEQDFKNDPLFARMFNNKPGPELLFQTTPIFVGPLIQAKCMNCHLPSASTLSEAADTANLVTSRRQRISKAIQAALAQDTQALTALLNLYVHIKKDGYENTLKLLRQKTQDYSQPPQELERSQARLKFVLETGQEKIQREIQQQLTGLLGSPKLVQALIEEVDSQQGQPDFQRIVDGFLIKHRRDPDATGSIFAKANALEYDQEIMRHVQDTEVSFEKTVTDQKVINAIQSDVDLLTRNYQRGEELYIAQACYACHRIAGFARGGVGPELTHAGENYPWFLKQSIVWPQADLPTSTMPNYRLDHEELQDLMTFLLGQNGENRAVASTAYRIALQQWEEGKKKAWEKPITPIQMHDLRYAMTVFATEGCSACHRLKGFESNVGYRVEKESKEKPSFDVLQKEHDWFITTFPETISGSELVQALERHAQEISQRIAPDVRDNSIIEQIDQKVPGQVEALYTPFKYAARAKNDDYATRIKAAADPQERAALQKQWDEWKKRVHNVLMIFIQEYGFGRIICPRLNWSGIFRSDEWLMEHFKNPTAHVPRSIMPVFPFDDTKFYALTYMLDALAPLNRDQIREIWQNRGFNPELAFQIYCSQCHGQFMQGNGPVSQWIYPVPKNLRNADFLRNLTKERAIQSITHGVKGTPMPPWGEIGGDKPEAHQIPVLTSAEISALVNWMFASLPGGSVIKGSEDVPKWEYTPEDVTQELQDEGNRLESEAQESGSQTIFDVRPSPVPGPDKFGYYIKKKYYTDYNIEQGKAFFELNCAVCHGKEADGTGIRASAMQESKPRMLTNLDWINTRDDLRLIRSIKFGVPGTAMNPWGDLTSSLQRLQLVTFIRTLSHESLLREELSTALYKTFNHFILLVDRARIKEYVPLAKAQQAYNELHTQRQKMYEQTEANAGSHESSVSIYQKELKALNELTQRQEIDQLFLDLNTQISKEKDLYQGMGNDIITTLKSDEDLQSFIQLIELNQDRYQFKDDKLEAHFNALDEQKMRSTAKAITDKLQAQIDAWKQEETLVQGRIASMETRAELTALTSKTASYDKLKKRIMSGLDETMQSRKLQEEIYQKLQTKLKQEQETG